jgi:hypothetical protein
MDRHLSSEHRRNSLFLLRHLLGTVEERDQRRPSTWRTKRTGESRSRVNRRRTISLRHGCFLTGLRVRQPRAEFPPIEALAAPRVRIQPAPPSSPSPFAIRREMIEIRACAAVFARLVAAENALDGGFCHFAARFIRGNQVRGHDENAPPRLTAEKTLIPKWALSSEVGQAPHASR